MSVLTALVSIPDGYAWVFKDGDGAAGRQLQRSFNPRWGCMGFQSIICGCGAAYCSEFQSPMGMHGFSKTPFASMGCAWP